MEHMIRRAAVIGVVPLALAAVVGSGVLFARDSESPSAAGNNRSLAWPSQFLAADDPEDAVPAIEQVLEGGFLEGYLEKLAAQLGITEEELREAMKQTSLELLDEAVTEGRISEEMAARLREAIEEGDGFIFGGAFALRGVQVEGELVPHLPGQFGGFLFGSPLHDDGELAAFLGISADQLREELNSGQTLAEVGEANGKSRDEMREFLTTQQEEHLQEAVDAGKLTAEEAEEVGARFAEHVERMLDAQVRMYDGEGDPPPGFTQPYERRPVRGGGLPFPWPDGEDDDSDEQEGQTY